MQAEIKTMIEAELVEFGIAFKEDRKSFLSKKITASGDLANSVDYKVDKQARADTAALMLNFNDYGRFIDMKRLNAVVPSGGAKSEYAQEIVAWMEAKGLTGKMIEGILRKQKNEFILITPDLLGRMAMGIIINRAKKVRPRKWYNKRKTAGIADVFNKVVAKFPRTTKDIIHSQFT